MTWSYSRLNCYIQCPYQFYLKYIECLDEEPLFFSGFGSLVHDILAKYHSGLIDAREAKLEYLARFPSESIGRAPNSKIRMDYFASGLESMKRLSPIQGEILGIEKRVSFDLSGRPFIGFVDCVYTDGHGALCILDHKSRALKPRSKRSKPTQDDIKLQFYLRQLYLYSIPIAKIYGRSPDFLVFNCYRDGLMIKEKFYSEDLETAKSWAIDTISQIGQEREWKPCLDYWRCSFLCGQSKNCEYKSMYG